MVNIYVICQNQAHSAKISLLHGVSFTVRHGYLLRQEESNKEVPLVAYDAGSSVIDDEANAVCIKREKGVEVGRSSQSGVCVCNATLLLVKERPEYLPEEPRQGLENGYHKVT